MNCRPLPLHLRQALALLLVGALLLTQALGLLHRVLHAEGSGHATPDHGRLEAQFAHDAGGADCKIFDQLSHADGVGMAAIEADAMPPAQPTAPALRTPKAAAQAIGHRARGPPRMA